MMLRNTILAVFAMLLCMGCATAENTTDQEAEAVADQTATVPANVVPPATLYSADLAGFPMPDTLPGEDYVVGEIHHSTKYVNQQGFFSVAFRDENDAVIVNINGLEVNCCTESLRAAITEVDGDVTVRLYEYLPDVCECTHRRDMWFELKGIEKVTRVTVYLNDAPDPVPLPDC